ncbi:hypothetical protein [Candidatus Sororendozoicomonas aggregata]|uniref:hypothetical protein n=1 Tax=Candidatus Sororendozoicomonas aggregata TaxID=3073239 RepID=UPI002ECFC990
MALYALGQRPPAIYYFSGDTQSGHIMWLRGEPFISWNCAEDCHQRLRHALKGSSGCYTCEHCGAIYNINISYIGVDIRQCPTHY